MKHGGTPRVPRSTPDKLRALDDHIYLLRRAYNGLRHDEAYLKSLATELRALVCRSSGTNGLLWRVLELIGGTDTVRLHAIPESNSPTPTQGLHFSCSPVIRARELEGGTAVSLKKIVNDFSIIRTSTTSLTYAQIISAVANQIGSAHEDDAVSPELLKINRSYSLLPFVLIGPPAISVLRDLTEFVLEVGERLVRRAEGEAAYERSLRHKNEGNLSVILRVRRREESRSAIPLYQFEFPVSDACVELGLTETGYVARCVIGGAVACEAGIGSTFQGERVLLAFEYSSNEQRARLRANDIHVGPLPCLLGWLGVEAIRGRRCAPPNRGVELEGAFVFDELFTDAQLEQFRTVDDWTQLPMVRSQKSGSVFE